ncbi:MAG: hypothetical protein QOJ23_397 [Actinomycetota bacterium]|nr:hypothetical protein [Actinomycetota bacterium]
MPLSHRLRRAVISAAVLAGVAVLGGVTTGPAGAAPARPPVRRVLVLSLPGTTWAAVADARTPNLNRLFAAAAVGNTSVRAIERQTRPGDGYVTIGAGTAAAGVARVEGLAFDTGERRPEQAGIAGYRLGVPPPARRAVSWRSVDRSWPGTPVSATGGRRSALWARRWPGTASPGA